MSLLHHALIRAGLVAGAAQLIAGCATSRPQSAINLQPAAAEAASSRIATASSEATPAASKIRLAAAEEVGGASKVDVATPPDNAAAAREIADLAYASDDADPFAELTELPLAELVTEVQRRNPTLQAAMAAWQAASERYPQVVALDDPMFQSMTAPESFSSSETGAQSSYYLGLTQKIPWAGKRALRGRIATAEAAANSLDYKDSELMLAQAARLAYFDYFLVHREFEVNVANVRVMRDFRESARSRYEASQVTQQDLLQAEVDLAELDRRKLELNRMNRVTIARLNTLLHRVPDHRLPPPPKDLALPDELPPVEQLRELAVEQRPDLAALASRLAGERAAVELACREFFPDLEVMGRYDSFWTVLSQRSQVGLNMNIPLNQQKRRAAVREAMFKVNKLQADYNQQVDNIRNDVEAGYARLEESRKTVALYAERILPAAESNVAAADSEYRAGKIDFLRLIEAQRQLIALQEKRYEAVVEFHRRVAEFERVLGTPLPQDDLHAVPPAVPPA